jgi:hypothetical protein
MCTTPTPPRAIADQACSDARWLRWSVAFVWLATGLLVFHPTYREIGTEYLTRLHLPVWLMHVTCAAEVNLGLCVALGRAATWITALQTAMIAGFTLILAVEDPRLMVHPLGVLTKNLPLLAVIGTAWLLEREGWTPRARWLLVCGVSLIWVTQGLLPKIFFHEPTEWEEVVQSSTVLLNPVVFIGILGAVQAAAGVLTLLLRGRPLRWLLAAELVGLAALTVLATWHHPELWVHPFGPLIKNLPIMVGTWVLLRHGGS